MITRRPRGLSMAVTLVTLLILSVLGLALGAYGAQNLEQIQHTGREAVLMNAAHGGLNELMDQLYGNPAAEGEGGGSYTTSLGEAHYWWSFEASAGAARSYNNLGSSTAMTVGGRTVPPFSALLVVNADTTTRGRSQDPVQVAALATGRFRLAVAADGRIRVADVRAVDGFSGGVWSNAMAGDPDDPATTIRATTIDGHVFAAAPEGSIDVRAEPSGLHTYDAGQLPLPNIPVDGIVESYRLLALQHPYGGPAMYQAPGDLRLRTDSSGRLDVRSGVLLTTAGTAVTTIAPPVAGSTEVTIYVGGDLEFEGSATLAPATHFFVRDDVVSGGAIDQIETTPPSENFLFAGGSITFRGSQSSRMYLIAGDGIEQRGSSDYTGVLYVQDGDFRINGGGNDSVIEGAVIVRGGDLRADTANILYNPEYLTALDRFQVSFNQNTPIYTVSWWIP